MLGEKVSYIVFLHAKTKTGEFKWLDFKCKLIHIWVFTFFENIFCVKPLRLSRTTLSLFHKLKT